MSVEEWLVVPDRPEVTNMVAGWRCTHVLCHASGRPWLLGYPEASELTLATVGSLQVAVIGSCPVTANQLTELVARVRTVTDLDAVARVLPGCWHLLASIDGLLRVQGSLTGMRRVFHTRIQGVPIVGNRAEMLARVTGAKIDDQVLAVRVACGANVPPPLSERSLWRGVRALAPDHYLRIDPSGTVREHQWWQPPTPEMGLTVGADAVRKVLGTAVAARRPVGGRLSADLSGGLDSTSLCFLAAQAGMSDLVTFRCAEADMANDDARFAAHAASGLPRVRHLVVPQAEMPSIYADPGDNGDTEAPYLFTRTLARTRHNATLLAAHGARHHLAGHGGDELFHEPPAYLHPLLRQRPWTTIRHARGYRALRRWPLTDTVSALTHRGDLSAWWHQQAQELTSKPPTRRTPDLGWGAPLRAPVWVAPATLDTAQTVLRRTAEQAQPLAADRGQHRILATLRTHGLHYRQLSGVFATAGLRLELPYLDDRVIEAALGVRTHERRTPWRYKPLLTEAMRPILPEVIATRTTKGEFSEDLRVGLRRHLAEILDIFADSALAVHGLINPDLLHRQLVTPHVDHLTVNALEHLLGCETWLRAVQTPPTPRMINATATAP
jgi:asparagine synthase (glutamine-hydrolysing)